MKVHQNIFTLKCPWRPVNNLCDSQTYITVNIILGDKITLIDSGLRGFWAEGIVPFLKRVKRDPQDVSLILHTHSHFDHVEADDEIREATGAKIAISEADAEAMENPEAERERMFKLVESFLSSSERQRFLKARSTLEPKPRHVDIKLKDHEILDLGPIQVECIPTFGHTRGGMCFYDYDNEIIFTGDAVDGKGAHRLDFIVQSDINGLYKSMEELSELDIETLLPGHNYLPYARPVLRGSDAKGLIRHTIAINDEIRKTILRLLKTYPRPLSAAEMSSLIVPRLGPSGVLPRQEPNTTIIAHLRALMEEGMVEIIEKEEAILWRLKEYLSTTRPPWKRISGT